MGLPSGSLATRCGRCDVDRPALVFQFRTDAVDAKDALGQRGGSRLLHVEGDCLRDQWFRDLPNLLQPADLLASSGAPPWLTALLRQTLGLQMPGNRGQAQSPLGMRSRVVLQEDRAGVKERHVVKLAACPQRYFRCKAVDLPGKIVDTGGR